MNAKTKSTGLWVFRERIVGAGEYHKRTTEGGSGEVEGIKVLNDSTLSITLVKPFAPFLSILTMPYCWIVPREAVEKYGDDFFKNPVGTGPFMFSEWEPDIRMVLKKNPKYFKKDASGAQLPYLETVAISFMRDSKTEFLEFEKGSLDMVTNIDPAFTPSVFTAEGNLQGKYKGYNLLKAPALSIEYYGIQLDETLEAGKASPLSKNKLLRQALNYAVNREQLVRYILRGKGISAINGVLPPTMPGFSKDVRGYSYDPQKARQLLAQAGFPNGKGLPKLKLQLGNSQTTGQVAEAIQQQWKEIGVNVELTQVDFPQHTGMVRSGKLPLWRINWVGDYPDPENFLALFYSANFSPGGPNTTHIRNARLDSLYTAALNPLLSPVQRYGLYNEMERIVLDEAPWIFLYYNAIQRLVEPSVKGLTVDGSDRLVLETVRKENP
jgi:peptide/nickel transport system substrate-binding protein